MAHDGEEGTRFVRPRGAVVAFTLVAVAKLGIGSTYAVSRASWMRRTGLANVQGTQPESWQLAQYADQFAWFLLGLAFAVWMRRFVRNSWALSNAPSVARSQWTGLFMAVPVLNLFVPAISLNHAWYSAHRDGTPATPDWPRMPTILIAWWGTHVGAAVWSFLGPSVLVWVDGGVPLVPLVELWLDVVALFLLWRIVVTVSRRQVSQARAARGESERPPLPADNGGAAAAG